MYPTVRLASLIPFPVAFGGLEIQCLRTRDALRRIGVPAEMIHPYAIEDKFDLVHLFGTGPGMHEIARLLGNTPIVITTLFGSTRPSRGRTLVKRGVSAISSLARQTTTYELTRGLLNQANHVICLNELERSYLLTTFNVAESATSIIPNGVTDEFLSPDPGPFHERFGLQDFVLFVGNIVRRKNPHRLAEALSSLDFPGVFIGRTVAWENQYADLFESTVRQNPRLLWIRSIRFSDPLLASAYAAARVFCLPSLSETQSLAGLEAMAAGTPLILGDRPYAYEYPFQGTSKCEPESTQSIRNSIERVLGGACDSKKVRLPGEFRWTHVAERLAKLYVAVSGRG